MVYPQGFCIARPSGRPLASFSVLLLLVPPSPHKHPVFLASAPTDVQEKHPDGGEYAPAQQSRVRGGSRLVAACDPPRVQMAAAARWRSQGTGSGGAGDPTLTGIASSSRLRHRPPAAHTRSWSWSHRPRGTPRRWRRSSRRRLPRRATGTRPSWAGFRRPALPSGGSTPGHGVSCLRRYGGP